MITHLPPGLAPYLNALYWGHEDQEESLELFLETWDSFQGWRQFHGSYSVNDTELGNFQNLEQMWQDVNSMVEEGADFEKVASAVYETVRVMDQVNEDRRFPHYSPVPAVNEMLLAGAAFCLDRGTEQALRDRLPMLAECCLNLRGLFHEQAHGFNDEIAQALNSGLALLDSGLSDLHAALPDKEKASAALADIKDGGSLVEFLLEWDQKEKQRLQKLYNRFNIPLIGSDLEIGLESLKSVERRKWRRGAKATEEDLFPQLDEFWATTKLQLFVAPEERDELLQAVEEGMDGLKHAVSALKEKEGTDEELTEGLEEALEFTAEALTSLEDATLKPELFGSGKERDLFEATKGLLAGTVPDPAIVELIQSSEFEPEIVQAYQEFFNDGSEESLMAATWVLHDVVSEREDQPKPSEDLI